MAGSDQSRNLGGMLSQIGNRLGQDGGLGQSFKDLMVNTQAPAIDPMDPASLDRAAQYASRTGNAQQASLYMRQAETLRSRAEQERQRVEAERKQAIAQAGNQMVGQYAQAVRSGEGEQEAYDTLMEFSRNAGVDLTGQVERIDQGARAAQDQQWQAEQQEKAKRRENAQQMAMGAMTGKSEAEMQAAIEKAPADVRDVYQTVANRELSFQNQMAESKERKEDLKTPTSFDGVDRAIESIQNEKLAATFKAERDNLEETKSNYWDEGKKQWKSLTAKREYEKQVERVHRGAFNAGTAEIVAKETRAIQQEEAFQRGLNKARSGKVTETEIENYQTANNPLGPDWLRAWTDGAAPTPSRAEAIAGVHAEREEGVRIAFNRGGDASADKPEGIPEGWTPEEWNALTPEEQASLR